MNNSIIDGSIGDIREILNNQMVDSFVNYDDISEEQKIDTNSKDTRISLGKKHMKFDIVMKQIGGELKYIKSGSTGHTFKISSNGKSWALKVVPYYSVGKLENIYNVNRPENAEIKMLQVLSSFVKKNETPHIILPVLTFYTDIDYFVSGNIVEIAKKSDKYESYKEFLKKYAKNKYYPKVSILLSEWADGGDLLDYIRTNHKNISLMEWKVYFFQILATLALIQNRYIGFRHNDLKANNVLLKKTNKKIKYFFYEIEKKQYILPNTGQIIKLWDFDFACIPNVVDNIKVMMEWTKKLNVTSKQHRYYDVHYFFNTLLRFGLGGEHLHKNKDIPQEVKDFMDRVVPERYRNEKKFVALKGRFLLDEEYKIPENIIDEDIFFQEFRDNAKSYKQKMEKIKLAEK